MPVINVRIGKGRSLETKRFAARAITEAVVVSLGVEREWVTVLFDEYDRENWASAPSCSSSARSACRLENSRQRGRQCEK
jgi:4-oxalocrotonate tautomerase